MESQKPNSASKGILKLKESLGHDSTRHNLDWGSCAIHQKELMIFGNQQGGRSFERVPFQCWRNIKG